MWWTTVRLLVDTLRLVSLGFQSRSQLAAENLFLRKQLALYAERRVSKPTVPMMRRGSSSSCSHG
jgi:hypothetical protein